MSSRRKVPPVIPVVGAGAGAGEASREDELREWEDNQRRLREQQAAAASPVVAPAAVAPAVVPAQSSAPTAVEPAEPVRAGAVLVKGATAGYLPMPEFTQPDSSDPQERLEFYSRGILAVQYAARVNHERAEQQKLIGLGLRLRAVKEEELHKSAGFDTFGDLTEARFHIKKHQANNVIRVLGVAQALEGITTQELKERPLRVLVPILDAHGAKAVRETWVEAARHGNVSDTALREAANFLGYAPPKEQLHAAEKKEPVQKPVAGAGESLKAVERIRALAAKDPALARREAEQLESAVRELLEELAGNLDR